MAKIDERELLDKGYIKAKVIIELVGNPKAHIEKTMTLLIKTLKQNKGISIVSEETAPAEDVGDGMFSTFSELQILFKSMQEMSWLAINFAPASIEVLEPGKLTLKERDITNFMNDLLSQVHQMNTKNLETTSMNKGLMRSINALLRNAILLGLGRESMTPESISKRIGVQGKEIEAVLDAMIKEGKLEKEGDKYRRK